MAEQIIRLGIIGLSPGNGHPYSWSAICNGYDSAEMHSCPFPVIPEYLGMQSWPSARIPNVEVTHIWTQDIVLSKHIAKASRITNVINNYEDMIGHVDGILLARDDAENHYQYAKPFLEAGLPIYIDKPLATSQSRALELLNLQQYSSQIFTCSALRFATTLKPATISSSDVKRVLATTPKYWSTYAVHIIEPIIAWFPNRGAIIKIEKLETKSNETTLAVTWENLEARFTTTNQESGEFGIQYFSLNDTEAVKDVDSFHAFKSALMDFLKGIRTREIVIPREQTLEVIQIIEYGER